MRLCLRKEVRGRGGRREGEEGKGKADEREGRKEAEKKTNPHSSHWAAMGQQGPGAEYITYIIEGRLFT